MHTCIYNYIHNIHIWASVNTLRTVKSTAAPLLLEGGARLISLFSSNDTYPEWYPLITYIASICLCIKSVLFTRCCNKFWRSKERPRLDMIGPAASWDWRGFECYYNCSCFHFHRRQWLFVAAISTSALYIYILAFATVKSAETYDLSADGKSLHCGERGGETHETYFIICHQFSFRSVETKRRLYCKAA